MKFFFLISYIVSILIFSFSYSYAQENMSVPKTKFYGRVVARQYKMEKDFSTVRRQFVALIPEASLPIAFFEGNPPATYFNYIHSDIVTNKAAAYTMIEPPFGGFNFTSVPVGNYWFCKFNDSDTFDLVTLSSLTRMTISGCQYVSLSVKENLKQNFYFDEMGFWVDNFNDAPKKPEQKVQEQINNTEGDVTCDQ